MALPASVGDVSAQFALDANALGNLKQQAKNDPKAALSAAATQFEALFMQMLLKSMRDATPQDGPLSSETTKTYTGMFDQQIAQQLAKKGVGVADMLVKQMSKTMPKNPDAPDTVAAPLALRKANAAPAAIIRRAPTPMAAPARPASPTGATGATGSVAATVQSFVDKLRPYAEAVAQKMGVPAQYLIAQAGLETGWGKSQPKSADGTPSHNLFGIKATGSWKGATVQAGTTEYRAGQMEKTAASFRSYGSYSDSLQDFAKLLQHSRRYASAMANTHDAGKYAASLQQAGYATDPHYADKLTRAIQTVARYVPAGQPRTQVVAAPVDKTSDLA